MKKPDAHILVIFGASGDLTRRKLIPALFELYRKDLLPDDFAIIGAGRTEISDDNFRELMSSAIKEFVQEAESKQLISFLLLLHYVTINTENVSDYNKLKKGIGKIQKASEIPGNLIFYMATPPSLYNIVPEGLFKQQLCCEADGWKRLIIEKPFGYDFISSKKLNKELLNYFSENQLYRIDHYLGKETVQNVMVTRFSNGIFEPLWNRNYIHHVEITSAESIGVENRGGYYDKSGALRDMVQSHLFQLVALVAMEPPTVISSGAIRNEILKVFQSIRPINERNVPEFVIRGQYTPSVIKGTAMKGYREEKGVESNSNTETFVALKIYIDNWRWGGVPFYIRTGKRLPTHVTEIVIHFNPTPHKLFCFNEERNNPDNQLIIRIQPDEGILLKFGTKVPGAGFNVQDVAMDFHYSNLADSYIPEAYQRLLLDCMMGDSTLYGRGDVVEQAWLLIDPILKAWQRNNSIQIYGYPAGTWGPNTADNLIEGSNMTWRYPCKNLTNDDKYCEL